VPGNRRTPGKGVPANQSDGTFVWSLVWSLLPYDQNYAQKLSEFSTIKQKSNPNLTEHLDDGRGQETSLHRLLRRLAHRRKCLRCRHESKAQLWDLSMTWVLQLVQPMASTRETTTTTSSPQTSRPMINAQLTLAPMSRCPWVLACYGQQRDAC
jgi:hypothetical protein